MLPRPRNGSDRSKRRAVHPQAKHCQRLLYVYASLSRLDFQAFSRMPSLFFWALQIFPLKKANLLNDALVDKEVMAGLHRQGEAASTRQRQRNKKGARSSG
jgi:hypothetical protein